MITKRINNTTNKANPPPANPNPPQPTPDIQSLLICFKEVLKWVNSCYALHVLMGTMQKKFWKCTWIFVRSFVKNYSFNLFFNLTISIVKMILGE